MWYAWETRMKYTKAGDRTELYAYECVRTEADEKKPRGRS